MWNDVSVGRMKERKQWTFERAIIEGRRVRKEFGSTETTLYPPPL
jgi:hypothetical protein